MSVRVESANVVDAELLDAVGHLLPQLSSSAQMPSAGDLESVVSSATTRLLIARDDDDRIVGMLTLATFRIPTGVRAWIEDVVVDDAARGLGAGRALVEAAIDAAERDGARTVDLTSRPSREAAHRLYESCGFVQRSTSVYRFELRPDPEG